MDELSVGNYTLRAGVKSGAIVDSARLYLNRDQCPELIQPPDARVRRNEVEASNMAQGCDCLYLGWVGTVSLVDLRLAFQGYRPA